jgi:hypothetical protein
MTGQLVGLMAMMMVMILMNPVVMYKHNTLANNSER